jgi:hypothetical protein
MKLLFPLTLLVASAPLTAAFCAPRPSRYVLSSFFKHHCREIVLRYDMNALESRENRSRLARASLAESALFAVP